MDDDGLDLLARCSEQATKALRAAAITAFQSGRSDIGPDDVKQGIKWAGGAGGTVLQKVCEIKLVQIYDGRGHYKQALDLTRSFFAKILLKRAINWTISLHHRGVGTEHLLLALIEIDPSAVPDPGVVRVLVLAYFL
jgi:hypothetical protein